MARGNCGSQPLDAEFRLRSPDGGGRWTNVLAAPMHGADGNIERWLALNINIDDRRRAEDALRDSEMRYRQLFTSMDEAYAVVEVLKDRFGNWADFRFHEVNPAFVEHTSMPWPVGKTATELLEIPNPHWTELYGQALDANKPIRVEESVPTLDRIFDLNIFPLDAERNLVAVLFTNVTERKRSETAVRQNEQRQRYLLRLTDILQRLSDPDDIKSAAMHVLGNQLHVSRAQYHEVDDSGEFYGADGIGYADGLPLLDLKYRIAQFGSFVAEDFEAGKPFRSEDLLADLRPTQEERDAYSLYQIREGRPRRYPLSGRCEAAARHDHVDVRMVGHGRTPCVEHGGDADAVAQVLWVGSDRQHGPGCRLEQQVVNQRLVVEGNVGDLGGQREHRMEVADRQQVGFLGFEPAAGCGTLALQAVPVATGVISDPLMPAVRTGFGLRPPARAIDRCAIVELRILRQALRCALKLLTTSKHQIYR